MQYAALAAITDRSQSQLHSADSNKLHRLTERDSRLCARNFAPISLSYRDPYFGLFGGFGFFGGYLATSGAKSDVVFLLSDPDFL